jgi:rhodanese-related sulfurtransferase
MQSFARNILHGALLMAIALGIGLVHNSLRAHKIKLIPGIASRALPAEASRGPEDAASTQATGKTAAESEPESHTEGLAAAGNDEELPSGEESHGLPEGAITLRKAKDLFDSQEALFIDARSERAYSEGHIPDAINVPYDKLADYYDTLTANASQDQLIVCYCWSPTCDFSDNLARELLLMGYEKVLVFKGGWEEWQDHGYPVETSGGEN